MASEIPTRVVCAHQVQMTQAGLVVADGPVVGCIILFVGLQPTIPVIRETAHRLRCATTLRAACPFAQCGRWMECPCFLRPSQRG